MTVQQKIYKAIERFPIRWKVYRGGFGRVNQGRISVGGALSWDRDVHNSDCRIHGSYHVHSGRYGRIDGLSRALNLVSVAEVKTGPVVGVGPTTGTCLPGRPQVQKEGRPNSWVQKEYQRYQLETR